MTALSKLRAAIQALDRETKDGGLAGYTDSELQELTDLIGTLNAHKPSIEAIASRRELSQY